MLKGNTSRGKAFAFAVKRLFCGDKLFIVCFFLALVVLAGVTFAYIPHYTLAVSENAEKPYFNLDEELAGFERDYTIASICCDYYADKISVEEAEYKLKPFNYGVFASDKKYYLNKYTKMKEYAAYFIAHPEDVHPWHHLEKTRYDDMNNDMTYGSDGGSIAMLKTGETVYFMLAIAAVILFLYLFGAVTGAESKLILRGLGDREAVFDGVNALLTVVVLGLYTLTALASLGLGLLNKSQFMLFYIFGKYRKVNCLAIFAFKYIGGVVSLAAIVAAGHALWAKTRSKLWTALPIALYFVIGVALTFLFETTGEPFIEVIPGVSQIFSVAGFYGVGAMFCDVVCVVFAILCTRYAKRKFCEADL